MKRLYVLLVMTMILMVLVCSAIGVQAERKYIIKIAHNNPANMDSLAHLGSVRFKEYIEDVTDGQIEVQIYPSSQLGGQRVMFESMQMGTLEMSIIGDAPIANWYPPINVIGIPYLFKDAQTAWKVLDGKFGQELAEGMRKKTGVRLLAYGENGFRHMTNNVHQIKGPDDLEGLKIRVQENPMHTTMISSMGGIPTPMAFGEVYTSLQQGVLDGQENPIPIVTAFKLYEVQKYLCLDGHIYATANLFISDVFYNTLTEELKQKVNEAAQYAANEIRELTQKQAKEGIKLLEEKGMNIYKPTEEDLEKFRSAAQEPVLKYLRKEVGIVEWVNKVLQAVEEVENK